MRPEPAAGADPLRAGQCRPRLRRTRRCSRSGRSSRATGRRTSSSPPPACAAALAKLGRRRPPLGRARRSRSMPSTPRPMRSAVLSGLGAPVGGLQIVAQEAVRPGLHPGRSGPLQFGPQGRDRAISARSTRACSRRSTCKGPLVAFEMISMRCRLPKYEADQGQAEARTVDVPAGDARLRLHRRQGGGGRRHRRARRMRRPR
jgi:hypothetical protein